MDFVNCKHLGTSFLILLPEQDGYIECSSQQSPLSALSVSLKAVILRNAAAQLRIYDVGAQLVRKTVRGLSAVQIQNIDFNRPCQKPPQNIGFEAVFITFRAIIYLAFYINRVSNVGKALLLICFAFSP